ncbi:MAG: type II toxin-antitoxin system mRNA interferase toxin, RelE/StbE family [Candidatus Omnitrophica bacterium]|nr:type II toxin-antitoxin system mRNA interferase toxin, RelE/StbE family [Candidatus Omnitrophota bacterium]
MRLIKGFHDEALKGNWSGFRSSRLSLHYRVIYRILGEQLFVQVMDVNAHDYRR